MFVVVLVKEKACGVCQAKGVPRSSSTHAQTLRVTVAVNRHREAIEAGVKEVSCLILNEKERVKGRGVE